MAAGYGQRGFFARMMDKIGNFFFPPEKTIGEIAREKGLTAGPHYDLNGNGPVMYTKASADELHEAGIRARQRGAEQLRRIENIQAGRPADYEGFSAIDTLNSFFESVAKPEAKAAPAVKVTSLDRSMSNDRQAYMGLREGAENALKRREALGQMVERGRTALVEAQQQLPTNDKPPLEWETLDPFSKEFRAAMKGGKTSLARKSEGVEIEHIELQPVQMPLFAVR